MKRIIFITLIFSTLAFTTGAIFIDTSVLIAPESQLLIKGTTNVNNFQCEFNIKEIDKPIPLYYKVLDDKIIFEKARLILDTDCFDCGNKGMNKDFRKLLKSDEHPEIQLQLKEIHKNKVNSANVIVELRIAGKSKTYYAPITFKDQNDIRVSGALKVNITDFGLEAPKKALGLIVVSEHVEINFQLIFQECKI